jgi:hypothetical protein
MIGGDFNIMRISSDKNKNFLPNRFSDIFNTIININGLRELYVSEGGGGMHLVQQSSESHLGEIR